MGIEQIVNLWNFVWEMGLVMLNEKVVHCKGFVHRCPGY